MSIRDDKEFIGMTMEERLDYDLPGQLKRARDMLNDVVIEQQLLDERGQAIESIISDLIDRISHQRVKVNEY